MSVLRSTARALTASALLLGSLAAPALVSVAAADPITTAATLPAPATTALSWLADELADGGGAAGQAHVLGQTFDFGGGPTFFADWGLTADAVMDLTLTGVRPTEATATLNNIQDHISDYVTGGAPADRYAGALGKSLLLAEITGRDPHAFGGFDLEQELRARLQLTGVKAGRFTDDARFGDPTADSSDFSNGFGQGVAMLALSRTHDGIPASAVDFLLAQQCPGGGFRGTYDGATPETSTRGCTTDAEADPDATAIALDVLITVPAVTGVPAATAKAITNLASVQDATGGFASKGTGGTPGPLNANTTGLAGQALRTAGLTAAADKAAAFVASLQLTPPAGIAAAAVGAGDLGAIAFDVADHDAAVAAGIAASARDKFHRATTQGVLAFGITPFGVVAVPPPPPATTTTTVRATTTTAVGATTTTVADPGATTTTVAAAGSTTTTTAHAAAGHLPVSGTAARTMALTALVLLAVGEIVRRAAREEAGRARR